MYIQSNRTLQSSSCAFGVPPSILFDHLSLKLLPETAKAYRLAGSGRRDVRALAARLATSEGNTAPFPARARPLTAEDVGMSGAGSDGPSDTRYGESSDWDTSGGGTGGGTVLIILLDDNAVLGDVR